MKDKKKIMLIEMSPFPYHIGGGYSHLCMLSRGLVERGYEVHIVSSNPDDSYPILNIPPGVQVHNVGMKHKMFGKGNKLWGYIRRVFYEWSFIRGTKKKIREIDPDMINTQSLITTSVPCSQLRRPYVATLHGIYMEGFKELWEKRGRKDVNMSGKFYAWLERYNLHHCYGVIGINDTVTNYYGKFTDSVTIENSIDCSQYNGDDVFKQKNKYLFLGRISEEKGIDYLIKALKKVDKKIDVKIEFNIAGSGDEDYIQNLKDQCTKLNHITINFLGPVYGKDKIRLFKSSSVFVLPSRFESFGIVLLEAMAAKCAVIASNASGPKGIIEEEFGALVDYTHEHKRVKNLTKVLLDSINWDINKMGTAARKEVEGRYDSNKAIDKYIEVYNEINPEDKTMKIAFMIPTFYPVVGGAQTNCYELAKELVKRDHDVSVFCSGDNDTMAVHSGIKVYYCKLKKSLSYYLKFYGSLDKILLQDFDVVHVHGFGFYQQDKIIKRLKKEKPNTKIVCTPHGPFMALKYGVLGTSYKTLYTPMVRKMAKRCDRIIQVNPFQFEWMQQEYNIPQKFIRLLPNGVPDELFNFIQPQDVIKIQNKYKLAGKYVLTYIGRIQQYKGIEQVIQALPELDKNVVLVAIGKDAGDKERLIELAKKLKVDDRVIFTGFISDEEKLCLLETSKIYVFPSEWEAFGIGTLEAMAKGNAVVSSRTEGGEYLVKRTNGNLFNYGDVKQLTFALNDIINDDAKRNEMGIANIKKAKVFKWSKIVRDLENIYEEIEK